MDLMSNIQCHVAGLSKTEDASKTVTLLKLAANEINSLNIALHAAIDSPKGTVPSEADKFYKPAIYCKSPDTMQGKDHV